MIRIQIHPSVARSIRRAICITEGFDGFAQGFARLTNDPADFLQLGAQFFDCFNGFLTVGHLAIVVKSLVRVDDAFGALINRMRLLERLFIGIQGSLQGSRVFAVFVHPVNQALDFFGHPIGAVKHFSLALVGSSANAPKLARDAHPNALFHQQAGRLDRSTRMRRRL